MDFGFENNDPITVFLCVLKMLKWISMFTENSVWVIALKWTFKVCGAECKPLRQLSVLGLPEWFIDSAIQTEKGHFKAYSKRLLFKRLPYSFRPTNYLKVFK